MHTLDAIDRKILSLLQSDSRATMQELADKVGLSVSPCHRRVKLLEERGVITRYIATVDQKSLGLHVSVFISIKLARQKEEDLNRFAKAISKWDEVLECYLMTGNRDYLLRVVAADLSSYEAFLKNKLTRLDGIASIEFEFCLEPGEVFDRAAGVTSSLRKQGPITTGARCLAKPSSIAPSNDRRGIWVPAFAGTTSIEPPHPETLVAPAAAGLSAILVQEFNRRSPAKRRALEIQRTPVAILAIDVDLPLRKIGRDQPFRARRPEIRNRTFDIRKRQMHETIAAQDRVASRQRISGNIGEMVFALDLACGNACLQALDQGWHDVDADQPHAQIGGIDPAGVAAGRIEQRCHAEPLQQPRQFRAQHGGRVQLRAQSRSGRSCAPQVHIVDTLKTLCEI